MSEYIRSFDAGHGVANQEQTPQDQDALYASPEEMGQLFGCTPTEADIRFAMALIHAHCNRPSLWPTEYAFPQLRLPDDRQEVHIPIVPVLKVLEVSGRYGYGRRDRRVMNQNQAVYGTLLLLTGGKPQWSPIDPASCDVDAATGIVYIPNSLWFQPFTMVRIRAVCGLMTMPMRIKTAITNILNDTKARGVSDRTTYAVGRVSQRFAGTTFISDQTKALLEPWVVRSLF